MKRNDAAGNPAEKNYLKKGSILAESSLVFPVIIIVLIFVISLSVRNALRLKTASDEAVLLAEDISYPVFGDENLLRLKRLGIKVIQ